MSNPSWITRSQDGSAAFLENRARANRSPQSVIRAFATLKGGIAGSAPMLG